MRTPKIYISGKITGLNPDHVIEKFTIAESYLKRAGYSDVVNPIMLDHTQNVKEDYDQYMKTDIKAMLDCNAIYMLPCWQDSKGAKIELQLAIQLNYNIIWGN